LMTVAYEKLCLSIKMRLEAMVQTHSLFHRKLLSYEIKSSALDRTAAEWKLSLARPAAG